MLDEEEEEDDETEIDVLRARLDTLWRDAQARADALVHCARYGPALSTLMAQTRLALEQLLWDVRQQHQALQQYATNAPLLFERLRGFYQHLHVRAQALTDQFTPTLNDGHARAAVPVDPASALNTLSLDGYVVLCSENEATQKYPPRSTLGAKRDVHKRLLDYAQYYGDECDALHLALREPQARVVTSDALTPQLVALQRHLFPRHSKEETMMDEKDDLTRLDQLLRCVPASVSTLLRALQQEQQACATLRDNALARLQCAGALYSNLTKTYWLHQAHRLDSAGYASIF